MKIYILFMQNFVNQSQSEHIADCIATESNFHLGGILLVLLSQRERFYLITCKVNVIHCHKHTTSVILLWFDQNNLIYYVWTIYDKNV